MTYHNIFFMKYLEPQEYAKDTGMGFLSQKEKFDWKQAKKLCLILQNNFFDEIKDIIA